jgi:hypothetical protein
LILPTRVSFKRFAEGERLLVTTVSTLSSLFEVGAEDVSAQEDCLLLAEDDDAGLALIWSSKIICSSLYSSEVFWFSDTANSISFACWKRDFSVSLLGSSWYEDVELILDLPVSMSDASKTTEIIK